MANTSQIDASFADVRLRLGGEAEQYPFFALVGENQHPLSRRRIDELVKDILLWCDFYADRPEPEPYSCRFEDWAPPPIRYLFSYDKAAALRFVEHLLFARRLCEQPLVLSHLTGLLIELGVVVAKDFGHTSVASHHVVLGSLRMRHLCEALPAGVDVGDALAQADELTQHMGAHNIDLIKLADTMDGLLGPRLPRNHLYEPAPEAEATRLVFPMNQHTDALVDIFAGLIDGPPRLFAEAGRLIGADFDSMRRACAEIQARRLARAHEVAMAAWSSLPWYKRIRTPRPATS